MIEHLSDLNSKEKLVGNKGIVITIEEVPPYKISTFKKLFLSLK